VKDPERRYIYVNEAKCRLTGARRDAIVGKTVYDFPRPKEELEFFVQEDDAVSKTGQESVNEEPLTETIGAGLWLQPIPKR
jgi:PAS domain-containing protein